MGGAGGTARRRTLPAAYGDAVPATTPPRRVPRVLVAALLVVVAGTCVLAGPAAAAVATASPDVTRHTTAGDQLLVEPGAVRAVDGRAELDVLLGTEAPADVVVEPRLAAPDVAADGTVTAGPGRVAGTVERGARLRPGERLRLVVDGVETPTLLVVEVRAASAAASDRTVTALVLPGGTDEPPGVRLQTADGDVRAVVTAGAATLVSVTVAGRQRVTFPDRLVLPDRPIELVAVAARWPLPAEVVVVDEAGRTVRASTGAGPLTAGAVALVAGSVVALVAVRRRFRSG